MTKTVGYPINKNEVTQLDIPQNATCLTVTYNRSQITLWVQADEEEQTEPYTFVCLQPGQEVPYVARHIGAVSVGAGVVLHVYEFKEPIILKTNK